ncbi:MAG: VanZ family protein [Clostridiales Family XIII bacterium]|jgi:glycopeptide antibiotics resistance protein|nr:VanZ family protein [Clostridiales Family XIII bacterium]
MDAYFLPIGTAAWQFPIIAALLTLPYAVYSYRKYGAVSAYRSLLLFSMLFYLQCAFYLVILPLPDPSEVAKMTGPYAELTPFRNVYDFIVKSSFDPARPSTWLRALRESYFLEPLFNLTLTIPFGVYLAYYFRKSLKKVILFSFLLSAFFELTQLTGLFFLYPRPYRLFDINDLLLNTLGGVCGCLIYTRFLQKLPSKRRIDERSLEKSARVGFVRRLVALLIDSLVILAIDLLLGLFAGGGVPYSGSLVFFVYYPAFALALRGRTPGKLLVKIRIERIDGGVSPHLSICLRYVLRNAFLLALQFLSHLIPEIETRQQAVFVVVFLLAVAFSFVDLCLSFRRGRRLWYEMLSKTRNASSFADDRVPKRRESAADGRNTDPAEAKDAHETDGV